jgi:hypothetical protein
LKRQALFWPAMVLIWGVDFGTRIEIESLKCPAEFLLTQVIQFIDLFLEPVSFQLDYHPVMNKAYSSMDSGDAMI